MLLEIAVDCRQVHSTLDKEHAEGDMRLRELIDRRRLAKSEGCKDLAKTVRKQIQKEIRAIQKDRKTARVTRILEEHRDLRRIANIRRGGKAQYIGAVIDTNGLEKTDSQDVAEVFADFFASIYEGTAALFNLHGCIGTFLEVTPDEVNNHLKAMRRGKAADESGIVAEFFLQGNESLVDILADTFSGVMRPHETIPEYWKASSIRVLFKKGDPRLPENYRPICIVPFIYKLFSKILHSRIKPILDKEQS